MSHLLQMHEREMGGAGWSDPSAFIGRCTYRWAESGQTAVPRGGKNGVFKRKGVWFVGE